MVLVGHKVDICSALVDIINFPKSVCTNFYAQVSIRDYILFQIVVSC